MELNYLAILGAAIAGMIIGMIWYMPQTFGTAWSKLVGVKLGEKDPKMTIRMVAAFVAQLVMAFVLATFIVSWRQNEVTTTGLSIGLQTGFWLWMGLIATSLLNRVLWEKAPLKLYWINTLYILVVMLVMGAILGIWA